MASFSHSSFNQNKGILLGSDTWPSLDAVMERFYYISSSCTPPKHLVLRCNTAYLVTATTSPRLSRFSLCQLTGADNAWGADYCPASAREETDSSCSPHPLISLKQATAFLHHEGWVCLIIKDLSSSRMQLWIKPFSIQIPVLHRFKAAILSKSAYLSELLRFSFVYWLNSSRGPLPLVVVRIEWDGADIAG